MNDMEITRQIQAAMRRRCEDQGHEWVGSWSPSCAWNGDVCKWCGEHAA